MDAIADRLSAEQLFEKHRAWALGVAREYRRRRGLRHEYASIRNAALAGLWKAARRYDASRKNTFASFALLRVVGEIKDVARTVNDSRRCSPDIKTVRRGTFAAFAGDEQDPGHGLREDECFVARIKGLTPLMRDVMRMRFVEDMDWLEIAKRVDKKPAHLFHQYARAIRQLKEQNETPHP
jgi:RNA polymerase sigma factor (sigma-70 family)